MNTNDSAVQKNEFIPSVFGMFTNECYLIRKLIADAIERNAAALGSVILDYGCGSKPYEGLFNASEYVGADIRVSGHPNENKKADVFFEGNHLPFPDNHFDGALVSEVVEHVFDLQGCLSEIVRVLKPGGTILITCPFVWPLHEEPYDFARYTPYALRQELSKAGLEIEKIEQLGTSAEVLGQIMILLFPRRILHIPIIGRFLKGIVYGSINATSRLVAKLTGVRSNLYLTNLVIARKR